MAQMRVLELADVADYAAAESATEASAVLERLLACGAVALPESEQSPELEGVRLAHQRLAAARADGAVYGLTTGVGALRHVEVDDSGPRAEADDETGNDAHALRLWRSHAAWVGADIDDGLARATMLVRLHQLLQGGAGVHPGLVVSLAQAVRSGAVPNLRALGAIGTGDLTVLAQLGLTLAGEIGWRSGSVPPVVITEGDALPFMSSNAMTIALAIRTVAQVGRLARAAEYVAALSHLALKGSLQAYDPRVHQAKADEFVAATAGRMTQLLAAQGDYQPARLQDPFGLRTIPQVHGALDGAQAVCAEILRAELSAAAENPLAEQDAALHHGQFLTQRLAGALDAVRAALIPVASLSAARTSALMNPDLTQMAPFLAAGPPGSSGLMIVEYLTADLMAQLRTAATAVTGQHTVVSLGLEEHASHSSQSAQMAAGMVEKFTQLLGCELASAVRALQADRPRVRSCPAGEWFARCDAELPEVAADHILEPELRAATALVANPGHLLEGYPSIGRSSSA